MIRTPAILFIVLFGATACAGELTPLLDPVRLDYNLKTTVGAYDTVGRRNPAWDPAARQCLATFARLRSTTNQVVEGFFRDLQKDLPQLAGSACDDPMIGYLQLRFVSTEGHSTAESAAAFRKTALAMKDSGYPAIRKFYATLWAVRLARQTDRNAPDLADLLDTLNSELAKAIDDPSIPGAEAGDAVLSVMELLAGYRADRWNAFRAMEPALSRRWTNAAWAHQARGQAYLDYAWIARGNGYANTVSQANWKRFAERIQTASEALETAWRLDPTDVRTCQEMIRVELAQGQGRNRMETWFQRGIRLDPSNYALCSGKMEYLRPRWHGSIPDMIAFGRECTFNTNYAGAVRLLLADAHLEASREIQNDQERAAYWRQKGVWSDVKAAFEQFFKLYPGETGYRHNYAFYAFRCGRWQEFLDQVNLFPSTNAAYFGGQKRFDEMIRQATSEKREP
ncbi:MAG: hypothetical protein JNL10_18015 [Verrucomicrobiales bacterium]|nr:hypothetical protein [Verrucomicrobiales bacterium]